MLSKTDVHLFALCRLIVGHMDLKFSTQIKDHRISSSKVKVIGQGHQGQKYRTSNLKPNIRKDVPRSRSKVKSPRGQGQTSQRSRSKVVGQGHRVKVKVVGEVSIALTQGRCERC